MLFFGRIISLLLFFSLPSAVLYSQNVLLNKNPPEGDTSLLKPVQVLLVKPVIINDIQIIGNKITKGHIILRELSFKKNDTISGQDIQRKLKSAKENILNTSLFNFVTIDTLPVGNDRVNVLVTVAERWYIWPAPIFDVQERNFNVWWQNRNFDRANYGLSLTYENFRGRKEELSIYAQFGYTVKYTLSYIIPYLTHKHISGAGLYFSYARNREVAYMTDNNVLVYFKNPDHYIRDEVIGKLYYTYRMGIHNRHYLEGKFVQGTVNDTLKNYSTDYFMNNETRMRFFALDYSFRSDFRDSRIYPLKGYYWEVEASKFGLGILKDEKLNITNLFLTVRGYQKLANRFYFAQGLRVKYSPNNQLPYYVQRGLGWGDYVRGYEYYVIDGQRYGLAKLGMRYEVIKPRVRHIPNMPFSKFNTIHYALYAGIFGDAGYVDDRLYSGLNPLANKWMYGYGAGVDFVTYYDIVFRFEYSFNKMMEHGFFVSFKAGI